MAHQTKSSVFAVKEEVTDGVLVQPDSGSQFSVLREGFSFESGMETVDSDELVNDIGMSKSFTTKETPSGNIPKYFKHSGSEGVAPDYSVMIKSAMGSQVDNSTEYDTVAGSSAGDDSVAGVVKVDVGEGSNFSKGQALLIKDGSNGYSIRNVASISGDDLSLNYNLSSAPDAGVGLGKAIHFSPSATGHPTFSAHLYQASVNSAYHQAQAGCRTTSMSIEFPANDLASIGFDFEGISFYINPIVVDASNEDVDFVDDIGTKAAVIPHAVYKTPLELARKVASVMSAASDDVISCKFEESSGKFVLSSDGSTFELLWSSGASSGSSIGATLGFDVASDDTGATSYEADNEQSYDAPVTPAFDDVTPNVVKHNELLLGEHFKATTRKGSNVTVTVNTPKTDVDDFSAVSGVSESVILEREVMLSATLLLEKHEIGEFDKLLNNTETAAMFNHGPKEGGNWVPGECVNVYIPQATVTSNVISDNDGFQVVEVEVKGFVSVDKKDCFINFV